MTTRASRASAAATVILTPAIVAAPAAAGTIEVKNDRASGPGSLQAAIERANRDLDRDRITFRSRLSGAVPLKDPDTKIRRPVKLIDAGRRHVTIAGRGGGSTLAIGAHHRGLPEPASTFRGLRMRRVSIEVRPSQRHFRLQRSVLSGGGIDAPGVSVDAYADLNLKKSVIKGFGKSGLSVAYSDDVRVDRTTIRGNDGVGIEATEGFIRVERSTVSGNAGGGLSAFLYTGIFVENSTLDTNGTPGDGPGLNVYSGYVSGISLFSSTIVDERSGAGAQLYGNGPEGLGGSTHLENSVLSGEPACAGDTYVESGGGNVIEDRGTCEELESDLIADPLLGPLADNGGPTETHALTAGSPAIGLATPDAPRRDQRGFARDSEPDSGSYERGARP